MAEASTKYYHSQIPKAEHEHLPIGMGDLDFELIFSKYLNEFNGNIILETPEKDSLVIDSMEKIQKIIYRML